MSDQLSSGGSTPNFVELAANIVSAYVTKNAVPVGELPALIASVHGALQNVASPAQPQAAEKPTPAVPIKKSVTPDAIISLEDGRPYKSIRRHITKLGMTPDEYKAKWGLPKDYPMVAASYAAKRSELAKANGLGQNRRKAATKDANTSEKVVSKAPKKGGRKKAA
ncbi:MAG TPA: MucR family transcriptional regulator [Microvirga sp.]|nr:MucR family transcriptional regulator [Microvirga sp.]